MFKKHERLAAQGNSTAQFSLGVCYYLGSGVEKVRGNGGGFAHCKSIGKGFFLTNWNGFAKQQKKNVFNGKT